MTSAQPQPETLADMRRAAKLLREEIIEAIGRFTRITGESKPEITISWMEITKFEDSRNVYSPQVFIAFKVWA